MTRVTDQGTYEMLWGCPACGTRKLLGLTHRFCPSCGRAQDPGARYFPVESEQVAVEDHIFVGADRLCPACGTPNANGANNCLSCGSHLAGAETVSLRADVVTEDGVGESEQSSSQPQNAVGLAKFVKQPGPERKSGSRGGKWVIGGGAASGIAALFIWSSPVDLKVIGHQWSRTISIESFGAVSESAWCDETPSDARDISRSKKIESYDEVEDGERCQTRQVDNGDGTFSRQRECTTKYRKEPVYADWCKYTVDRWHHERKVSATGNSLSPKPEWPPFKLRKTGNCIGCERKGRSTESYRVQFSDQNNQSHTCNYDISTWSGFAVGSSWVGEVGKVTGLKCNQISMPSDTITQ